MSTTAFAPAALAAFCRRISADCSTQLQATSSDLPKALVFWLVVTCGLMIFAPAGVFAR